MVLDKVQQYISDKKKKNNVKMSLLNYKKDYLSTIASSTVPNKKFYVHFN